MSMKSFLTEADREQIRGVVRAAETETSGEIVVMVVPASDTYPMAAATGAAAFALPAAAALTPITGGFLWVGHQNMWIFMTFFILCFVVFRPLIRRLPTVLRVFIPPKEMESEVWEAAVTCFYREKLHDTREANGILVFVSVLERQVRILADHGIDERVPTDTWASLVDRIVQDIKGGRQVEALCQAVESIGGLLKAHFPVGPDDQNELENLIVKD